MSEYQVYTDGGSRGNPGPSGCGVYIVTPDKTPLSFFYFIGTATNNIAEYKACVFALQKLNQLGAKRVTVFADSELMIKQITGIYRVKNEGLIPLYREILQLMRSFEFIQFKHVKRELNKEADKLANHAMDTEMSCEGWKS